MVTYSTIPWRDHTTLDFNIQHWNNSTTTILVVHFSGDYGSHRGDNNFILMNMVIAAALAWDRGDGLIIDLSQVVYEGGDQFFYWTQLFYNYHYPAVFVNYPIALICSRQNLPHIRSLIADQEDPKWDEVLYMNMDEAIQYIEKH